VPAAGGRRKRAERGAGYAPGVNEVENLIEVNAVPEIFE